MMRYIGICLLAFSAAGAGSFIAWRLKKRVEVIKKLIVVLSAIKTEIKFSQRPMLQIFENISQKRFCSNISFFKDVTAAMRADKALGEAWAQTMENSGELSVLSGADMDILRSLGAQLGTTDTAGQMKICELHLSMLESNLQNALENSEKYGKMCSQIGLFAGAAIGILLI